MYRERYKRFNVHTNPGLRLYSKLVDLFIINYKEDDTKNRNLKFNLLTFLKDVTRRRPLSDHCSNKRRIPSSWVGRCLPSALPWYPA